MSQHGNAPLENNYITYNKQPQKISKKGIKSSQITHPGIKPTYVTLKKCYNMFGDGVGGIDPKKIKGAKLTMYYNNTSQKDMASHQTNYNRSI